MLSSFILFLLTLSILIPINLKGEKTIAASGDTSTTSLTLSTTSGSAELDLLVTSDTGTFASSTTPLSFSASTNNYTGYTLSIKSATSNTALTNNYVDGNNNSTSATFTSLSSTNATAKNGITATTFNSSAYNNQWGFKPSYYNSVANSNNLFYPSPDATGVTLNRTSCANSTSTSSDALCKAASNEYTISIGARATYAQVAGTYTNKYILSAVGNYPEYKITYHDASGESTDLPTTQEISSTNNETAKQTSISFSTTEPTRDGYKFIGWCSVDNSADPTTCSGTIYDPGDTYVLDLLSSNTMPLYAVWAYYIQNLTLDQCKVNVGANGNAANIGDNITVYDRRDNSDYTVRYINGQCWMTQNLRITGTISSTDSNFTRISNFNVSEYDLADSANAESSGPCYGDGASGGGLSNACSHDSGSKSTGAWYNYAAATAGQITGISSSTVATQDICPAGWHLPTGPNTTSGTDFNKLAGNTISDWQSQTAGLTAFDAVPGGTYHRGSILIAEHGVWWSATPANTYSRYNLVYDDSYNMSIGNYGGRYGGVFVRCVFDEATIADVTYMQEVTPAMVAKMTTGQTATLKDSRDQQDYTVKKIGSLLWMTKNLNLAGGTKLTSADTNLATGFTLPASSTSGFSDYNTDYVYNSNSTSCGSKSPCYSYYSFYTATAHWGTNSVTSGSSSVDICPYGWRLPTSAEYITLRNSYSTGSSLVSNWNAVYSGYYNVSAFGVGGSYGYYWSSTAYDSSYAYRLNFNSSSANVNDGYGDKHAGLAIRCVAKS